MSRGLDITGMRFGSLTAIRRYSQSKNKTWKWLCRCDCGEETVSFITTLHASETACCKSCRSKIISKQRTKHGMTRTPTYLSWRSMIGRCDNSKNLDYYLYGGRGIKICERWKTFENFLADMGERPPGTSLDRENSNGDYEPENCRWSTPTEQANNRRNSALITFDGRIQTLSEWSKEVKIGRATLDQRLKRGWTVEKAFTIMVTKKDGEATIEELTE